MKRNNKIFLAIVIICLVVVVLSIFFICRSKTRTNPSDGRIGYQSAAETSTIDYTYLPSRNKKANKDNTSKTENSASNAGNESGTEATALSEKEKENYFNNFCSCLSESEAGICSVTDAFSTETTKSATSQEISDDNFVIYPETLINIEKVLENNKDKLVDETSFEADRQKSTEPGYLIVFGNGMIYNNKEYGIIQSDSSSQVSTAEENGGIMYITKTGINDNISFYSNSNQVTLEITIKDNAISKIIDEYKTK